MTLLRRAQLAGADARDHRAGYPLGVLYLRGSLADPWVHERTRAEQNAARHDAGLRYAADHAMMFGMHTPKSHLAAMLEGIRNRGTAGEGNIEAEAKVEVRYRRKIAAVQTLDVHLSLAPFRLLERVVIDEDYLPVDAELPDLRRALAALVNL